MLLKQLTRLGQLFGFESVVGIEFHELFNPELRFAGCVLDVNVGSPLLAREEVEAIAANPQTVGLTRPRIAQVQARETRSLTFGTHQRRLRRASDAGGAGC